MRLTPGIARRKLSWLVACGLLSMICLCSAAAAQRPSSKKTGHSAQYSALSQSIQGTLKAEQTSIQQLKAELNQARQLEKEVSGQLAAHKIQISANQSLLRLPTARIEDLQKAQATNQTALDSIAKRVTDLSQKQKTVDDQLQQTEQQYASDQQQLVTIKTQSQGGHAAGKLLDQLRRLIHLLEVKRNLLEQIDGIYKSLLGQLQEMQDSLKKLVTSFTHELHLRQREELFRRKTGLLSKRGWQELQQELTQVVQQVHLIGSARFWHEQARNIWQMGGFLLVTAGIMLIILELLLLRFRKFCAALSRRPFAKRYPWLYFSLQLFHRSVPLLGLIVFGYGYSQLQLLYYRVPVIRESIYILLIWLFTRWGFDFLTLWKEREGSEIAKPLSIRLRGLLITIRLFGTFYVIFQWMLGSLNVILLLARLAFEVGLLVWSVSFWRSFQAWFEHSAARQSKGLSTLRPTMVGFGYALVGGGLLLELIGFGQLALYWYVSWGRTAVVVLWGTLLFLVLWEWDQTAGANGKLYENGSQEQLRHSLRWLFIRVAWLLWLSALAVSLLLAWGAKRAVIVTFFQVFSYTVQIGSIHFNLLSIVYAFLVLAVTHAASRLWRQILKNRLLARSGLESGLQESITVISVYLFWTIGILVALHAIGLSTTSITVAFGALGIGLGFGLQTIFNNFISGIILLFERPIQVGDALEINGVWGVVRKINVRSTVVQTWDNASLIIPNSEFVTARLTNWSFKDLRLRRNITVGVAYGSDVELVRETLLEIAGQHPDILKYPRPDVLFSDFGDSALVFNLRAWSTVERFYTAESEIRFEINRLFRERNIEIAFPQRDIHIRSVVKETEQQAQSKE